MVAHERGFGDARSTSSQIGLVYFEKLHAISPPSSEGWNLTSYPHREI
jgi:hypothetical protein